MLDFKNKLRLLNNLIKLYSNELNTIHPKDTMYHQYIKSILQKNEKIKNLLLFGITLEKKN